MLIPESCCAIGSVEMPGPRVVGRPIANRPQVSSIDANAGISEFQHLRRLQIRLWGLVW